MCSSVVVNPCLLLVLGSASLGVGNTVLYGFCFTLLGWVVGVTCFGFSFSFGWQHPS